MIYQPVRNAAYRLERHDSLVLQYPGGATQEQVRDRVAFLHVTLTEAPTQGPIRSPSCSTRSRRWRTGSRRRPIRWRAARGTGWTGLSPTRGSSGADGRSDRHPADELTGRLRLLFPALPAGRRAGGDGVDRHDRVPPYRRCLPRQRARGHHLSRRREADATGREGIALQTDGSYDRYRQARAGGSGAADDRHGHPPRRPPLGLDGVLVSAQGTEAGDMTITVPTVGQTVPVKQFGSYADHLSSPRCSRLGRRLGLAVLSASRPLARSGSLRSGRRRSGTGPTGPPRRRSWQRTARASRRPPVSSGPARLDRARHARGRATGEDARFWTHGGIDYQEVRRALGYRRGGFAWESARDRAELWRALGELPERGRRSAGPAPSPSRWPRISTCRPRGIRCGR